MSSNSNILNKITLISYIGINQRDIESVILSNFIKFYKFIHVDEEYAIKKFIKNDEYDIVFPAIDYSLNYISKYVRLKHIIYNGLPYYDRTNEYHIVSHPTDTVIPYDKNSENNTTPIYYPKYNEVCYITGIMINTSEILYNIIREYSTYNIIFIGYNKISSKNISDLYGDERGKDHCQVKLPCEICLSSSEYISFNDLINTYYNHKQNKFDTVYEEYQHSDCYHRSDGGYEVEITFY